MHQHPVSVASTPWNFLLAVHGSQEASRPGTVTGACWATSGTHTGSGGSEGLHGAPTSAVLVSAVLWPPLPSVSTPPGSGAAIVCPPFCSTPQKILFKADRSKRNGNSGMRELLTKKSQRRFPWVIKQDRNPASNSGSEEDGRGPRTWQATCLDGEATVLDSSAAVGTSRRSRADHRGEDPPSPPKSRGAPPRWRARTGCGGAGSVSPFTWPSFLGKSLQMALMGVSPLASSCPEHS